MIQIVTTRFPRSVSSPDTRPFPDIRTVVISHGDSQLITRNWVIVSLLN